MIWLLDRFGIQATACSLILSFPLHLAAEDLPEQLWMSARRGDTHKIESLLEQGVDVDARTPYGATALLFACSRGHVEAAEVLLRASADANVKDRFYGSTPMSWAGGEKRGEIIKLLVQHGAKSLDNVFTEMVRKENVELVTLMLATDNVSDETIRNGAESVRDSDSKDGQAIRALLSTFELDPLPSKPPVDASKLERHVGVYASQRDLRFEVRLQNGALQITTAGGNAMPLEPEDETTFRYRTAEIVFQGDNQKSTSLMWKVAGTQMHFKRVDPLAEAAQGNEIPATTPEQAEELRRADMAASSDNWPQFRGTGARGVADGQAAPVKWDGPRNRNIKWKTEIPGLGHACPVIWDGHVFITTAVSEKGNDALRIGLYGDVDSVEDESRHAFQVFCLDQSTGKILWERTAITTVPAVKRHLKSTHANPTIATDGKHVIAFFGSEGLYCYDRAGELVWSKDLGPLDSGWFYDPDFQWGFGSSPVIYRDMVIVQCDIQKNSFIAALHVASGEEIWRTPREEIPTWSSPTVVETPDGPLVVTNGTRAVRGYDAETGEELWQLRDNSEIVVPTPFAAAGLIFAASGYRPIQPIHAIRFGARGDLTAEVNHEPASDVVDDLLTDSGVSWSLDRGGPYMPTPLVYREFLYVCSNSGIVTCYHAATGKQVYKKRLKGGGTKSFIASPIASDGKVYFTAEDGHVYVVTAGRDFEQLYVNPLGEYCLTTPAVSNGSMIFRGQRHMIAVEQQLTVDALLALETEDEDDTTPEEGAADEREAADEEGA